MGQRASPVSTVDYKPDSLPAPFVTVAAKCSNDLRTTSFVVMQDYSAIYRTMFGYSATYLVVGFIESSFKDVRADSLSTS